MCAVTGTSRGEGAGGGSTSSAISEIEFFSAPVQLVLMSPEALPARSTLFNGRRALETAAATSPICTRESCRLRIPFWGDGRLPPAFQFAICRSPCALPLKIRAVNLGSVSFSGVRVKVDETSTPEACSGKDGSLQVSARASPWPSEDKRLA